MPVALAKDVVVVVISLDQANRIHNLLQNLPGFTVPYKEVGDLCGILRSSPQFVAGENQGIDLVDMTDPDMLPDDGSVEEPSDEPAPDLKAVDGGKTKSGLPDAMKEKAS